MMATRSDPPFHSSDGPWSITRAIFSGDRMHGADADYLAENLPNEDALWEMTERAMRLPEYLGASGPYRRYPSDPPMPPADWAAYFTDVMKPKIEAASTTATPVKPPITDAIQREKAYSDAKFEQRRGGGAALSSVDRSAIEAHIKTIEQIANDIELRRIGNEVIDSAVATIRLASLGLVRASSPVQGAHECQ